MSSKTNKPSKISKGRRQQETIAESAPKVDSQRIIRSRLKGLGLLVLAATYSPISQLTLSPVYGSIPSSFYHQHLTIFAIFLVSALDNTIRGNILLHLINFLPVLAFAIPTVQFYLFQFSGQLGPVYGPLITELLTYCPLVFISILGAAELLDFFNLTRYSQHITNVGRGLASLVFLSVTSAVSRPLIEQKIGSSLIFRRSGLQFLVAIFYTILLPSKYLLLAVLPLLHTLCFNVHSPLLLPTEVLVKTLKNHQYVLVDRQESLTGYISVLDNLKDGFRVMRCDHSLLGGEWTLSKFSASTIKEPVYSVFVVLEAVRLVASQSAGPKMHVPDNEKHALVIGLGVGTTPSALIAHGINTTVVELDPVVYQFATKYFGFMSPHNVVIEDATVFVEKSKAAGGEHREYDYIIHDVFTGGAEPIGLFTQEFLQGLSEMLTVDGVIAINYAGDLFLPPAGYVVRTIKSIFPACRLYREDADPTGSDGGNSTSDFTNMVIFCRKSSDSFAFRKPVEADFLGTHARRNNLWPLHEIDGARFDRSPGDKGMTILKRGWTKDMEKYQNQGAVDHWKVMRRVLPDAIWENW